MALALGKTVAQLEREMSSAEFSEWIAYSHLEPFGERRADQRAWLLVAHASNMMRDPQKHDATDLRTILPEWQPPQEPEDVAAKIDRFFRMKMAADAVREGLR